MPASKKKVVKKEEQPPQRDEPAPLDPIRVEVGARLQAARKAAIPHLTQADVAERFQVNKNTVSAWEKGRGAPDIYVLRELMQLYRVSADALLWGELAGNAALLNAIKKMEQSLIENTGEHAPQKPADGKGRKSQDH